MYVFAAGWAVASIWLWYSGVQQHITRHDVPPPGYAAGMFGIVVSPAPLLAACGYLIRRLTGPAPTSVLERREWVAGFWWALVPNWILFETIYVMIRDLR